MKWVEGFFYRRESKLAQEHGDLKTPEPFSYGTEYIDRPEAPNPLVALKSYASEFIATSDRHFESRTRISLVEDDHSVRFNSRISSDVVENNIVHLWHHRKPGAQTVVLVLPYWNAVRARMMSLAKLVSWCGHSAAIMSLPYHDERQPAGWSHAKGLVSSNIGLTLRSMTQAACDAIDAISALRQMGYRNIAIMGSSIGACVASLVDAHDPRPSAVFLILMAADFAECVWDGISTAHIRQSVEGHMSLDDLKAVWAPISPATYVWKLPSKPRQKRLIISGRWDFTFPRHTVLAYREKLAEAKVPHVWLDWCCGHYTLGKAPFKYWFTVQLSKQLSALV